MANRIGSLTRDGDLKIEGSLSSRIPPVHNGLVANFPFDGSIAGELWGDGMFSGYIVADGTIHDIINSNTPLEAGQVVNFSGWFRATGLNGDVTFSCYHQINGTWNYQSIGVQNSLLDGKWVYIKRSLIVAGASTDTLSNFMQGVSVRNNCTTGKIEWKNCRCSIDAVTSNCTLTKDGIYVEEISTNLWNGLITNGSSGNWSVIDNPFPSTPFPRPAKVIKCTPKSSMEYWTWSNTDGTTYPAGTVFTFSAWCFVEKGCDTQDSPWIYGEGITGCPRASYDKTEIGTWQYLKCTVTSTGSGFYFLLYPIGGTGATTWTKGNVYYANVQVEKRGYNTLYTQSAKTSSGSAKIVMGFSQYTSWSLVMDYKHPDLSSFPNNMVFASSYDGTTGSWWFGLNSNSNTLNYANAPSPPNKWNRAIFTYDGTSTRIYVNGTLITTVSGKYFFSGDMISFSSMIGWNDPKYLATHQIKNVSFYNKVLSTQEISKIFQNKMSLQSSGDLRGVDVTEGYLGVPSDAYYYPLDFEPKDSTKITSATTSQGLQFEAGCMWVGMPTVNQLTDQSAFAPAVITSASYNSYLKEWTMTVPNGNTSTWRGIVYTNKDAIAVPGGTYVMSFEVYADDDGIPMYVDINNYGVTTTVSGNDNDIMASRVYNTGNTVKGRWVKMNAVYTFSSSLTQNFYMQNVICFGNGFTPTKDTSVKIRKMQIEQRSYPSPFTLGSRPVGKCYLPVVLAQNTNFTINIFARAVRSDSQLDLFCDDSDRWNGQLRCTKGSTTNSPPVLELLARTNNRAATQNLYQQINDPSDYKWHMYTLSSKANQGAYLYVDGVQVAYFASLYPQYTCLSVGRNGMGDANVFEGYYRDLSITTGRYMTDAEILSLWNRKMAQKDSLYIQGQLRENVTL